MRATVSESIVTSMMLIDCMYVMMEQVIFVFTVIVESLSGIMKMPPFS
ncbi:hypothetical protein X763_18125 [Mesorhizobium sp. LSHC432A00]|nr:hypothetical protein X766_22315 [Mesorhizobium sp. LSJC255A00]ESX35538.1 hypothetical protein X763_18125 [Mesorhizobium sp. LSHC432A00]ESX41952.1 hypothetical protein X764_14400 [Mesorhizobium sp. LSHC440A00]ESX76071.1 hypothetical protein X757_15750 [Mesorhizobium sp. LSHC414A00]